MSNYIYTMPALDSIRLGWALVHFLWQGLVIALVLELALGLVGRKNASLRYVLCGLALAAMPVCLLDTYFALDRASYIVPARPILAATEAVNPASSPVGPVSFAFMPVVHTITEFTSREIPSLELNRCIPAIVACWLTGMFLLAARKAGGFLVLRRLRRRGVSAPDDAMRELFRQACDTIGVDSPRVALKISHLVQVPMTMGWVKPIVLFPAALLSGLSTREIELLLAHELAHVRRCDYLVNLLQTVVETVFFYHPVTWWVSRRMRQERENSCDDLVAARSTEVLAYATVLFHLESLRSPDMALATAANGGSLLQRIQRLIGEPAPTSKMGLPVLLMLLFILGMITAVSTLQAQATDTTSATNSVQATDPATSTNTAPATTPTPSAPAAPAATTAAPSATAAAAPSTKVIYYQDSFGRKGELDGSSPDAKNTSKATWTVSSGPGAYTANGSAVSDSSGAYDAAFLPVNGTSGITLDGNQNFTVSATVAPDAAGNWLGISVTTAPITNGHNIFDGGLAELTIGNGNASAYNQGTSLKYDPFGDAVTAPYVISMTYHATSGTITYSVGDSVIASLPNVTADQIASLNAVAMGNGAGGPTGLISQFTLSVGGRD